MLKKIIRVNLYKRQRSDEDFSTVIRISEHDQLKSIAVMIFALTFLLSLYVCRLLFFYNLFL